MNASSMTNHTGSAKKRRLSASSHTPSLVLSIDQPESISRISLDSNQPPTKRAKREEEARPLSGSDLPLPISVSMTSKFITTGQISIMALIDEERRKAEESARYNFKLSWQERVKAVRQMLVKQTARQMVEMESAHLEQVKGLEQRLEEERTKVVMMVEMVVREKLEHKEKEREWALRLAEERAEIRKFLHSKNAARREDSQAELLKRISALEYELETVRSDSMPTDRKFELLQAAFVQQMDLMDEERRRWDEERQTILSASKMLPPKAKYAS